MCLWEAAPLHDQTLVKQTITVPDLCRSLALLSRINAYGLISLNILVLLEAKSVAEC